MRAEHADGVFDLLGRGAQQRAVSGRAGHGAVHDVVDFVALERVDLGQAAADLVEQDHRLDGVGARQGLVLLHGRDDHGVVVVVAELAGLVAGQLVVEAEDGAVGVPLAHRGGVRGDGLLGGHEFFGAEDEAVARLVRAADLVGERLIAEEVGRVGLEGEGAEAANHGVGVEKLHALDDLDEESTEAEGFPVFINSTAYLPISKAWFWSLFINKDENGLILTFRNIKIYGMKILKCNKFYIQIFFK